MLDINRKIQELEQAKTYKYFGTQDSEGIRHQEIEEGLKKKYTRRLRMVLKSQLTVKNNITATGTLAIPVLKYCFGKINWRLEEMKILTGKL